MARARNKWDGLRRFLLVLAVLAAYCAYAVHSFGLKNGLGVTALTWAFFIFCTPVADAGFLVAFPIRIITSFRMFYTQIIVWLVGFLMVVAALVADNSIFNKTGLLELFHKIIVTPWPLGLIIVLSAIGTYVNIRFDDDVYSVATSRNRRVALARERAQLYSMIGFFGVTFLLYVLLLHTTHTNIKIF